MTTSLLRRTGVVLGVAAVTIATLAGVAGGQTSTSSGPGRHIDEGRRRVCVAAIDARLVALDVRQHALADAIHLTDAHRAALNANIDQTRAGLRALEPQIKAETDPAALKSECSSVWTGYRVFALVLPRTRLVTGADAETFAAGRLTAAAGRLQAAIDNAKAGGKDVMKAQADLDAMKAKTSDGQTAVAGVAGSILPLTPADWNANHDVLKPAHASDKSGRDDLKAAAQLAHQVVADLKS